VGETGSEEVVKAATAALALLAVDPHAKVPTYDIAGKQLLSLTQYSNAVIAKNALAAIRNACEHPQARIRLQQQNPKAAIQCFAGMANIPTQ
jgi:hypothetical protein